MNVLVLNILRTHTFGVFYPSFWSLLRAHKQCTLGILDLVCDPEITVPDLGIADRIDWRQKEEIDSDKVTGKQVRWIRKWMQEKHFMVVFYDEFDIDTHLARVVTEAGGFDLHHVILPPKNDCDFLLQTYQDMLIER